MLTTSGKTKRVKSRGGDIKIVLISEDSQRVKNSMIYNPLKKVADQCDSEVDNYGMYTAEDEVQITYAQAGTLAAAILNGKAVDYVIMGCSTGEGVVLTYNSFPGMIYGHAEDAPDTYTPTQVNDGNAIVVPFAKGFGWGGNLSLEYTLEKLFHEPSGQGYPKERAVPEQRSKWILDDVRKAAFREDLVEVFKGLGQELVRSAFTREKFGELFFGKCKDERLAAYIRELIG